MLSERVYRTMASVMHVERVPPLEPTCVNWIKLVLMAIVFCLVPGCILRAQRHSHTVENGAGSVVCM